MPPTSTLMLLSAVHSTTVLSGPYVTPSILSPTDTTVLTYDLWKGGLVCFAVAIVSVAGYFYRRRRKDTMFESKLPGLVLPVILPRDGSVLCSPSDTPYDTALTHDRSVLQIPMVQTGTVATSQVTDDQLHVGDVTEADYDYRVQISVPTIAISVTDEDFISPLLFQRALDLSEKKEDDHEESDDDISVYSSESAEASLHNFLLSEIARPHVNVPEITCEHYMTVVACGWPARSYNFDISVIGTTLRGGAFLTLPSYPPSPLTLPARPRSTDDRRHGLVEMSDLASALATKLDHPSSDIALQASDMSPIPSIARRHGQADFSKYADALNAKSGIPSRCHRSLAETHSFGEQQEGYQDINSRLMDDLLQSINEEVEFYNSFSCDEDCDDISDDTYPARKHTSPTWDYLDFLEEKSCSFPVQEDADLHLELNSCNEQLSPMPDYPGCLTDEKNILGFFEGRVLSSVSKEGEYGTDDELTSNLQQLSIEESETSLNHISGGTSGSAILDLIRLLDEQIDYHKQPVHGSIPEVNNDGFDLLRFVNEDLRLSADDKCPIVNFERDDDCDDDNYTRFLSTASHSKSSLSESEDGSVDDYGSTPSLASVSDIDSDDDEVIIAPITGCIGPFPPGSNHRRSPAGCFFVTPATPTRSSCLIDAFSRIDAANGELRTQWFIGDWVPFTDEQHLSGIPTNLNLASKEFSQLDLDIRFSDNSTIP
ncbi:uncharacterized protein EDB93DRAFT_1108380 [Suillus bovinus]|uniref:uncharacterized protein n=1 Tax=Suillus bovinus TaxID=48563 RepID=UPI001B8611BC|nr:uncharacterized protein EDB93DRAFT_1108380 [Suillus bovinus]KAG2130450.1 hypothetical protein EDB93DRAFT_1108380 [Suillus bovinus]